MIQGRKAALADDGLGQLAALIGHYCHEDPAADWDAFQDQAARALWLEERYFTNLAKVFGTKK